jgi:hypothetical protein
MKRALHLLRVSCVFESSRFVAAHQTPSLSYEDLEERQEPFVVVPGYKCLNRGFYFSFTLAVYARDQSLRADQVDGSGNQKGSIGAARTRAEAVDYFVSIYRTVFDSAEASKPSTNQTSD